ncbi:uncharacterized protein PV09_01456 [Verruconis gallopava]|uniref:Phosphatidate cytidylyltransferase n=1 Tax=Verruconis gallopava TaxID=253628 RepID=A0A0D1XXL3_9PEZI|nr:uncharacterized protein PV09_01456 [Verruconis gallopava]KIW07491.1 hypothetical protein PV09_01456 [Verruconis gallopava]
MSHLPSTPRVISPSPTASDMGSRDSYFGPITRSVTRRSRGATPGTIAENARESPDPETRARTRSRSPVSQSTVASLTSSGKATARKTAKTKTGGMKESNGHLAPPENRSYWREISRSPSPLGLIPVHLEFRQFIHRHEIPRKALHVSIGFLTTWLYTRGYQVDQIHPILLTALIPIAASDVLRHRVASANRLYIKLLGALMRETEVDGYNGVIWYLLGAWAVLRFCPKDIGTMSVILLSWCDTAASTFGRLWGRYTPRIRKGKSLAGSLAAMVVGVATAAWFWGYVAPNYGALNGWDTGKNAFAFQGQLSLPSSVKGLLGWKEDEGVITGSLALGVFSLWTGFVASASEAVDLFHWDDNLTIPVLSAAGLWGFLKVFGSG